MLPNLHQLLRFRHPQVIRSYVRDRGGDENRANELFTEMLKFLWISRKHIEDREKRPDDESLDFLFVMHEEMREMDNMWHNFILYTKDYAEFCNENFGEYLHHQPDVADGMSQAEADFTSHMERYLSYVYDSLGEQTVRKWFAMHL